MKLGINSRLRSARLTLSVWIALLLIVGCGQSQPTPLTSQATPAPPTPSPTPVSIARLPPSARTLNFPEERSVGTLRIRGWADTESSDWELLGEARGEVKIPAWKAVRLHVNFEAGRDLAFLDDLAPDAIENLSFSNPRIFDDDLDRIVRLKSLEILELDGARIDDEGLAHLSSLPRLRELNLSQSLVTDKGLEKLVGFHQLRALKLDGTSLTDAGLELLSQMTWITDLSVRDTEITRIGFDRLQAARPDLGIAHSLPRRTATPTPIRKPVS